MNNYRNDYFPDMVNCCQKNNNNVDVDLRKLNPCKNGALPLPEWKMCDKTPFYTCVPKLSGGSGLNVNKRWKISILIGIVFLLIASPEFVQILSVAVSKLGFIILEAGNLNTIGLIVQGISFIIIVRVLMELNFFE